MFINGSAALYRISDKGRKDIVIAQAMTEQ